MGAPEKCAFSLSLLWCLFCVLSVFSAQELDHFEKDTIVNFEKDQVLADSVHQDSHSTSTIGNAGNSDETDSEIKASTRRADEDYTSREDAGTSENVDGATVTESRVTVKDEEAIKSDNTSKTAFDTSLNDAENDLNKMTAPPHIIWPNSQSRIIVKEKKDSLDVLLCRASGNPTPTFKWLRDGNQITNSENLQAYDNGTLVFLSVSRREEGIYQCLASNSLGTSVSVTVPIVLERPPKSLSSTAPIKNYEGNKGDPMSIECANVDSGVPAYSKRWYLSTQTAEVAISKRVGYDTQGVLRFAHLEMMDSASYVCALAPEVAEARDTINFFNTAVLKVNEHAKSTANAKLAYASGSVKAVLGMTATLECFFYGNPAPNITWRRASTKEEIRPAEDKRFVINPDHFGRRLVIVEVREEDSDSYICIGANGYGTTAEGITFVNVTSPPLKIPYQGLDTIVRPDGGDEVLKCKAKFVGGRGMSTPQWYKNGETFNEDSLPYPKRYSFNDDQTELTIRGLNKEDDTACFQCNISNSEGYIFYDGYLRVINSIRIDKSPSDTVITNTSVIDLAVLASGDDCCKIDQRWYLNNKSISSAELRQPPFDYRNSGKYFIFNASTVDEDVLLSKVGDYVCSLSNNHEVRKVTFTISLKGRIQPTPEPLKVADTGMQLWWIGLVCGILLIIIAVIVVIIIVKSNYPGDTYLLEKAEIKHNLNPEQDLLDQSFHEV